MPYLIDGHNLIHYMDDIRLGDPNDEAELVIKLRGFCARRKKKAVVIFDQGLPITIKHAFGESDFRQLSTNHRR
jgi:hypothetical protein